MILEGCLIRLQESLPTRKFEPSLLKQIMALFQTLARVVPRTPDKKVVLQHFFGHWSRQEAFVCFSVHLDESSLLPSDFLEVGQNTGRGVVVSGG